MASYFLDSSALVKRYVLESGTAWVRNVTERDSGNDLIVARISLVEITSALVRHFPASQVHALANALAAFHGDIRRRRFRPVAITQTLVAHAMRLVVAHRLRAYDAVQLAAAWKARATRASLPAPIFVSADLSLNAAAVEEGFATEDPNARA